MSKVLWIDTETTGLDPKANGIVQLALLVEIDGKVVDERLFQMNPIGKDLDPEAMHVHGITKEQIETFLPAVEQKQEISGFMGKYVNKYDRDDKFTLAGFNVGFDLAFLEQLWIDAGDRYLYSFIKRHRIDIWSTIPLLKWTGLIDPFPALPFLEWAGALPELPIKSLLKVAETLGYTFNAHDALEDIKMTRKVAQAIADRISQAQSGI